MEEEVENYINNTTTRYTKMFLDMAQLNLKQTGPRGSFIDEEKGIDVLLSRVPYRSILNMFTSNPISKPEDMGIVISDYYDGTELRIRFIVLDAAVDLEIHQDEIDIDCFKPLRFFERIFYNENNKLRYERLNEQDFGMYGDNEIVEIMSEINFAITLGLIKNKSKCIGNVEELLVFYAPIIRTAIEEIFINYKKNKKPKETTK